MNQPMKPSQPEGSWAASSTEEFMAEARELLAGRSEARPATLEVRADAMAACTADY